MPLREAVEPHRATHAGITRANSGYEGPLDKSTGIVADVGEFGTRASPQPFELAEGTGSNDFTNTRPDRLANAGKMVRSASSRTNASTLSEKVRMRVAAR